MNTKCGYVTIAGRPNVGKSTLLNALLGQKLSIINSKPQTTRKRVLGILSEENYQIIFIDTAGIIEPKYLMQQTMMEQMTASVDDADVLLVVFEAGKDFRVEFENDVLEKIKKSSAHKIAVINKIDGSNQKELELQVEKIKNLEITTEIIPISALKNFNIEPLRKRIVELLPEHPKMYPDDDISTENVRFFVTEIIREKILELYDEEIPYSIEVVIEDYKERDNGKDFISASIITERASQKGILIGKKGAAIKKLGELSRKSVEDFTGKEVFLELRVKVEENWRQNEKYLKRYGYTEE